MKVTHLTPILNVSDVPVSLAWFESLGWKRCWTYNDGGMIAGAADSDAGGAANFAAVGAGECEIFLCRDGQGSRGRAPTWKGYDVPPGVSPDDDTTGVWMSWWVATPAEVDEAAAKAAASGVAVIWPPTDEPWGCRECRIVHPDGHTFRIAAPLTGA